MPAKRFPLPRRFNAAMSELAYENLRKLNQQYGYGNNYLLTILLENLHDVVDAKKLEDIFSKFESEYGAPTTSSMKSKK